MLRPSAHEDTFARDNLPDFESWPALVLDGFNYPDRLNVAVELTESMVARGFGSRTALIGEDRQRTYQELNEWTNQLAHALVDDLGVRPGNRVLIRSANNPAFVACWLAVTKVGAVAVNTMPLLRATELVKYVEKAQVSHALCDTRLMDELLQCQNRCSELQSVAGFDGTSGHDAELDRLAVNKPKQFDSANTSQDDVALLAFTSGSTGEPKATMHFHRDLLIIADGYAKEILGVTPEDVFVGSPPLAFTFGLGGLAVFPLRFGATGVLYEAAAPPVMGEIIARHRATICFTAPTAYRVVLQSLENHDISSLRLAVSAGETLPGPIYDEWIAKTGKPILDGIGTTELLHIFISNRIGDHRGSCTGRPVNGYEAKVVDAEGKEVPAGITGSLALRGPTGCRYLCGDRQREYVQNGWNICGDAFSKDSEGYFHFAARNDDMIISSGYNIAGPEVESALLSHPSVAECAVVGAPDEARGFIVQAHVVLAEGALPGEETTKSLQDHVKATIAPYKYPRSVVFVDELPKTATGKVQRYRLRSSK
ncbi:MAG: AMP-binding protein [Gammaproteobacteria bacterium]|nr:AMP-binding protein [Gammaproteobacteria bacterium]